MIEKRKNQKKKADNKENLENKGIRDMKKESEALIEVRYYDFKVGLG